MRGAANLLHSEQALTRKKERSNGSVTAVAVDLAADFAARPSGAVNVYVSSSGSNGSDQFIKFSGADSAFICQVSYVDRGDGA